MNFEAETRKHIQEVGNLLQQVAIALLHRATQHDMSKLAPPERKTFEEYTPMLADTTYNSTEYKGYLKKLGPALVHHYKVNAHHPEHHRNGIDDMNLVDIVEMLCDWIAASKRHNDGDPYHSIIKNQQRFQMAPQLTNILLNTVDELECGTAKANPHTSLEMSDV